VSWVWLGVPAGDGVTGAELLVAEAVRLRAREPQLPASLERWDSGLVYRPGGRRKAASGGKHTEPARRRWSEVRNSGE